MQCPIPISSYPNVLLAHGGGGRLMHDLIAKMFAASFDRSLADAPHDGAVLEKTDQRLAFTTDSFVVSPIFFPGGDIGSLAVFGTVNDLAMCGARPKYLSASFILEEGLPMETLWRVVESMSRAARECDVRIVTGDTKVVERGKADGLFVNTAGIGVLEHDLTIGPKEVRQGDRILLSGDVGRHGMAIMAVREGLEFKSEIHSDAAPVHVMVLDLIREGVHIHCLRDATRGGVATVLNEIAAAAGVVCEIDEKKIPVHSDVRGACEILGFDPLYVANEGTFLAFVPESDVEKALTLLRRHAGGREAESIGRVSTGDAPQVVLTSVLGTTRLLPMLSGEQLPRIC
ncbi:MAG: hydrogenase expression/formation protein HypE [Pseudomonadota bacterium]